MAGLASVLVAVVAITGFVVLFSYGGAPWPHVGGPVAASAAPDPLAAEAFKCSASIGLGVSGAPTVAYIGAVRVEAHSGYERLTMEFTNGRPRDVLLSVQPSSTFFPEGPDGKSFVLRGTAGAQVTIHGADGHTHYHGPTDVRTSSTGVLELRQMVDAQGTVLWAIGLSRTACYRAAFYENPARLIVDFQVGAS
jgi:hypothetical protein